MYTVTTALLHVYFATGCYTFCRLARALSAIGGREVQIATGAF